MKITNRITISPVTRISGLLEIVADIEGNIVKEAKTEGLMYRGFEQMLEGRSPFDAIYLTQRICGICSTAHSVTSAMALEEALNITVSEQGRYLRDFIHGCEYLQNHIRHFYQYTAPDFIRLPEISTLFETDHNDFRLPKAENDRVSQSYFDSLQYSRNAHKMLAILGGKAPHNHGVFVCGITSEVSVETIERLRSILLQIRQFITSKMLPDAYTIAHYYSEYFKNGRGYGNFLSFGYMADYQNLGALYVNPSVWHDGCLNRLNPNEITESVQSSRYISNPQTYMPFQTMTEPDPNKPGAYSWVKAPRYRGLPFETGPLARMWLSGEYRNGISTMDRTLARVHEAKKVADCMLVLLDNLIPCTALQSEYQIPKSAWGAGLIDTTRGALGHWMKIDNSVISFYQVITPSAWNLSTRGPGNEPGPVEAAMIGTTIENTTAPVELGRIIRSFDPCVSCATHVYTRGLLYKTLQVVP